MSKKIVYLNGKFVPIKKATISVMDRGFLFADGAYEVIPIYDTKLFGAKEHLDRLERSLDRIQMQPPLTHEQWDVVFNTLLQKNKIKHGNYHIYLEVTRGAPETRSHAFPKDIAPTIFVQINQSPYALPYEQLLDGKKAITAQDTRWEHCHIKSIALLPNILFSQRAKEAGAVETILLRDGYVLEGASSNVFIVKDNVAITPALTPCILAGITRQKVLELAAANNITYKEHPITEQELKNADEIWIASSTREVYPITQLDEQKIGTGKAGEVWQKIIKLYHEACRS